MLTLDWTLAASALIFLATLWALNSLLFRPLLKVLAERSALSVESMAEAERTVENRRALDAACEGRAKEAKHEAYQVSERIRQEALASRQEKLVQARDTSEARLREARLRLEAEVETVRKELGRSAEEVARLIASRVLERS